MPRSSKWHVTRSSGAEDSSPEGRAVIRDSCSDDGVCEYLLAFLESRRVTAPEDVTEDLSRPPNILGIGFLVIVRRPNSIMCARVLSVTISDARYRVGRLRSIDPD
jgi:hypothetical protein